MNNETTTVTHNSCPDRFIVGDFVLLDDKEAKILSKDSKTSITCRNLYLYERIWLCLKYKIRKLFKKINETFKDKHGINTVNL